MAHVDDECCPISINRHSKRDIPPPPPSWAFNPHSDAQVNRRRGELVVATRPEFFFCVYRQPQSQLVTNLIVYFPRSFLEALVNGKRDEFFLFFFDLENYRKKQNKNNKKKNGCLGWGGGKERQHTQPNTFEVSTTQVPRTSPSPFVSHWRR